MAKTKSPIINIFSENIYPDWEIDEKKAIDFARKTLLFFIEQVGTKSALQELEYDTISFDILYCSSEKTHEINRDYRKKDSPADIITFAVFADSDEDEKFIFDGEINLGEIILALDKVEANAKEKGTDREQELYFLIAHGILHLLGFDHQTQEDFDFVVDLQNRALCL